MAKLAGPGPRRTALIACMAPEPRRLVPLCPVLCPHGRRLVLFQARRCSTILLAHRPRRTYTEALPSAEPSLRGPSTCSQILTDMPCSTVDPYLRSSHDTSWLLNRVARHHAPSHDDIDPLPSHTRGPLMLKPPAGLPPFVLLKNENGAACQGPSGGHLACRWPSRQGATPSPQRRILSRSCMGSSPSGGVRLFTMPLGRVP